MLSTASCNNAVNCDESEALDDVLDALWEMTEKSVSHARRKFKRNFITKILSNPCHALNRDDTMQRRKELAAAEMIISGNITQRYHSAIFAFEIC